MELRHFKLALHASTCALLWCVGVSTAAAIEDWSLVPEKMSASMQRHMREHQIPGGILVIVRSGQVLMSAGFGLADIESQRPVDPITTAFRIASISKPFTALAAARLAEQGVLDLDTDISEYLGESMPQRGFDDPITLRQLLTHTAGFDNTDLGDAARTRAQTLPLKSYIEQSMPRQTTRPGDHHRYTNQGYALAGLVIERVAGRSFAQHMSEAIFAPLDMRYATFDQPDPNGDLKIATGYALQGSRLQRLPYDYSNVAPADAMLATADDMSQFLLFQLGHHENGHEVISDQGRRATHDRLFSHTGKPPAMTLGWNEINRVGERRYLEHSGGQLGFTSYVAILPDDDVGFFIALNLRDARARIAVLQDFFRTFLPEPTFEPPAGAAPSRTINKYVGRYRSTDYPLADVLKSAAVFGVLADQIQVRAADDVLIIDGARCVPIGPDRFQREDGSIVQQFDFDNAKPRYLYVGKDSYERLSPYEWPSVTIFLLFLVALTAIVRGVVFPVLWLRRKKTAIKGGQIARFLTGIHLVFVLALILFLALVIQVVIQGGLDYGAPPSLAPLAWCSSAAVILAPAGWLLSILAVVLRRFPPGRGVLECVFATILLAGAWLLLEMNVTLWV